MREVMDEEHSQGVTPDANILKICFSKFCFAFFPLLVLKAHTSEIKQN